MKVFHAASRTLTPAVLALTTLLASCGQNSQQAASSPTLKSGVPSNTVTNSTVTYAQRQAALPATPPEPVASARMTDLTNTFPGGKPLNAQALDKSVPIILVHGMMGFGRDELGGVIKYWGGSLDVQEDLRALGYKVYTASVGPVSSNWARSAELYAQIKGGCVDYGAARAAEFGHDRFDKAKCYAGFYPQWDAQHPVNLIGHSLGGPTSRMLVKLLEDGSPANADGNNLFRGGRVGWVKNVMTISSPNSGSPAADNLQTFIPFLQETLVSLAAAAGNNEVYNFDLGQYGLTRQPGERFDTYVDRVMNSKVMTSRDNAGWDLRPDGSKELNAFIGRSQVTKYFSWATNDTSAGLISGWHYPNVTLNTLMVPLAYPYAWPLPPGLGNMSGKSEFGGVTYDRSWWANDGIVPSNYMDAPIGQTSQNYTGQTTLPGQWYALGTVEGYDHLDITGNLTLRDVKPFYRNQAAFLSSQ